MSKVQKSPKKPWASREMPDNFLSLGSQTHYKQYSGEKTESQYSQEH